MRFAANSGRRWRPGPSPGRQQASEAVAAAAALAQRRVEIRPTAAILEFVCGATNSLDPYSSYLTADQLSEVYSQIEGNFVGLGIELKSHAAELVIVRVITGSPAEQAGLRAGDRILAVNGASTKNLPTEQAANMLQGEEGTTVALTVAADGTIAAGDRRPPAARRGPQRRQGADARRRQRASPRCESLVSKRPLAATWKPPFGNFIAKA